MAGKGVVGVVTVLLRAVLRAIAVVEGVEVMVVVVG